MLKDIRDHDAELRALCAKHHVSRLDVFGSATRSEELPLTSDIDFVVEFEAMDPGPGARSYFDLLFGLQELFGREIDLITESQLENPYFRESVQASRECVYAA
jgi:uncharacterized protein